MTLDFWRLGRATGLMDRSTKRGALHRLIEAVRSGRSRAPVMRGDRGVGMTVPPMHSRLGGPGADRLRGPAERPKPVPAVGQRR